MTRQGTTSAVATERTQWQ